jgi:kelch-like protein 2/3
MSGDAFDATPVNGVATFSDLRVYTDANYRLAAVSNAFPPTYVVYSQAFNVTAPDGGDYWSPRASIPAPREFMGVGTMNGIVYAVGGYVGGSGGAVRTMDAYDPSHNTWTNKTSMDSARSSLGVGVVNGILYAVGGYSTVTGQSVATVEAYDPATDKWTTKTRMPTPRHSVGIGVLNGILYAIGGYTTATFQSLDTVEAYNPATDQWSTMASMPTTRCCVAVVADPVNGILYAIGGDQLTTVEAYDPVANTWSPKPSLDVGRDGFFGAAFISGVVYVVGGGDNEVEALAPSGSHWVMKAPLLGYGQVAVAEVNGIIYAIDAYATGACPGGGCVEAYVP